LKVTHIVQPQVKQIINVLLNGDLCTLNFQLQLARHLLSWSICVDKFYKIGASTILSVTHGGRKWRKVGRWWLVGSLWPTSKNLTRPFNSSLLVKSLPFQINLLFLCFHLALHILITCVRFVGSMWMLLV